MDSEHRHELEENALARWLADTIEEVKPQLPTIGLGLVVLVGGLIGWTGWKASAKAAEAERWRDFAVAVEGARPNMDLLKSAAEANEGTAVEDWSRITWADGKLWEASRQYLRNRELADEASAEAIEVYERLVASKDRLVAERAAYQLGRAYELRGELDNAKQQYGRVSGAFADLASARVEDLDSDRLAADYDWITAVKTSSATQTIDPSTTTDGDLEPDDIALPEVDADTALDDLLQSVEDETEETSGADDAESSGEESPNESE